MKIESVTIRNFRSFKDQTIHFNDYTAFIGTNGSGKSTVLLALNVFFQKKTKSIPEPSRLYLTDFFMQDASVPIEIKLVFKDLGDAAKVTFADYYRDGRLIVSCEAKFDAGKGAAEVEYYGMRRGLKELAPFFAAAADGKKVEILKEVLDDCRSRNAEIPAWAGSKEKTISVLREFEASNPNLLQDIRSRGEFYGFTKGAGRLDASISYVYVPAVKDAGDESSESKNTAIADLMSILVRRNLSFDSDIKGIEEEAFKKYADMLKQGEQSLAVTQDKLSERLRLFFPEAEGVRLNWTMPDGKGIIIKPPVADVSLRDRGFEGAINSFGHGVQRSYLMAVLTMLAETSVTQNDCTLFLACEEPELYQHPAQARYLGQVLSDLSTKGTQVAITTHSPYFVSADIFDCVRLVSRRTSSEVKASSHRAYSERVAIVKGEVPYDERTTIASLYSRFREEIAELFFSRLVVLVEGPEDAAIIHTALTLASGSETFLRRGGSIINCNGKAGFIVPATLADLLGIKAISVVDGDHGNKDDKHWVTKYLVEVYQESYKDDREVDYFGNSLIVWSRTIQDSLDKETRGEWSRVKEIVSAGFGMPKNQKEKNPVILTAALKMYHQNYGLPQCLSRLVQVIIKE